MHELPPKTQIPEVSNAFQISPQTLQLATILGANPTKNQNSKNSDSNENIAGWGRRRDRREREVINVVNLGKTIEPNGQYYGNDRTTGDTSTRYCNDSAFIQTRNGQIKLNGGCAMINKVGGMGIAMGINVNNEIVNMVIISRDGRDVMAYEINYFNTIFGVDVVNLLNHRSNGNARKIENILLGNRSEIKTLDKYVAHIVNIEGIDTSKRTSVIPQSSEIFPKNRKNQAN